MRTLKSFSIPELKRATPAPFVVAVITKSRVHITLGERVMIFPCYRDVHGRETVVADPIRFFCHPEGTLYEVGEGKRDFAPLLSSLHKIELETL